ncbi:hypothetical protein GCM10022235_58500 [Kribbella ginsengisoli]|uniref:VCBS repeat-containing protein n=1 Tax=Kribbella ginsengisoli TaxID=363865 RepID=A0ABP6YDQ5_9ACTN
MLSRNADGSHTVATKPMGEQPVWAWDPASKVVAGDYDGDGKDDLASIGKSGQSTATVALAYEDGSGKLIPVSSNLGSQFNAWAADPLVRVVAGDFNGDGKDDLLLHGRACYDVPQPGGGSRCERMIPIAYGAGGGQFSVEHHANVTFYDKAVVDGPGETADVVVGDFNADGNDDLVVYSRLENSQQAGTFNDWMGFIPLNGSTLFPPAVVNDRTLAERIMDPGATPVAGDFNKDGFDDIAVVGRFDQAAMPMEFFHGPNTGPTFSDAMVTSPATCPDLLGCSPTNG